MFKKLCLVLLLSLSLESVAVKGKREMWKSINI